MFHYRILPNTLTILLKGWEEMDFFMPEYLKEKRNHGHAMLPLDTYTIEFERNTPELLLHWHPEMEVILVLSGEGIFKLGLDLITVKVGDVLVIPPHTLHGIVDRTSSLFSFHSIVFSLKLLQSFQADATYINYVLPIISGELSNPILLRGENEQPLMINCLQRIVMSNEKKLPAFELELKAELYQLFVLLFRFKHLDRCKTSNQLQLNKIDILKRVVGYIHINYPKKMTVSELATLSGYSEYHFMRFFKIHIGMTVFEYIRAIRLDFAARQLLETNKSVTEISYSSGFDSATYFTKSFKEKFLVPPSIYRKEHKKNNSNY